MGQLQDQMKATLLLRGFRPNTCESYLRCVKVFVRHYGKSPREMGKVEVQEYLRVRLFWNGGFLLDSSEFRFSGGWCGKRVGDLAFGVASAVVAIVLLGEVETPVVVEVAVGT